MVSLIVNMKTTLLLCFFNEIFIHLTFAQQRVAPGVPPHQYQQQPPQYEHYQPQYQQPQQHVQPNVPQQQHVPPQQVPQQHVSHQPPPDGHHHDVRQPGQILNTANIANEKQHIQEHMEVPIDTSKMSEQELQFHYFKMHDADNNNKLDGCELIKSLIHWHEQGRKEPDQVTQGSHADHKIFYDEELLKLIEPILGADDGNNDGFIDYPEFVRAQKKAAVQQQQTPPAQR